MSAHAPEPYQPVELPAAPGAAAAPEVTDGCGAPAWPPAPASPAMPTVRLSAQSIMHMYFGDVEPPDEPPAEAPPKREQRPPGSSQGR